ncbi:DUF3515 family protein [Demequina sp. SYSU T00068]|uniref:DUF3515 family protein n=1 Tax=Demequina lignilytica TaxID=3051663 RepID=UPI00261F6A84|nr:DUF3515 family protein [Demequina sp. SYSU T00068]MDN4489859.1 DUF3515 family protein [Demequina sp. SYSU T00068]
MIPRPAAAAAVLAAAAAPLLTGCASPLVVDPAPYAADVDCARVMLAMPEDLGGLPGQPTSSQATAAWGEEYPLVMRCGVEPPGPTTDECLSIETSAATVDWLVIDEGGTWRTVTFGRSPAVELVVPKERAQDALGDVLAEVSPAAALAPANGLKCR